MTCPTCGSPRPAERLPMGAPRFGEGYYEYDLCTDAYHDQILSSEERERVLPAEY